MLLKDRRFYKSYENDVLKSAFMFPKYKLTFSKAYAEIQQHFRKRSTKEKTIIFDIDETLIAADSKPPADGMYDVQFEVKVKKCFYTKVFVRLRPFARDVLKELSKKFEIILFTTGTEDYAEQVSNIFVQKKRTVISHVLSKRYCLYSEEHDLYIKDLTVLLEGRSFKDIIIVDNLVFSYLLQLSNGIPVKEFRGDMRDNQLLHLLVYL